MIGTNYVEENLVGTLADQLLTWAAGSNLKVGLVVNNPNPDVDLVYSDLVFATFGGSTPKSHSTTLLPLLGRNSDLTEWQLFPRVTSPMVFQVTSLPVVDEIVYGMALYRLASPNRLLAYERLPAPIPIVTAPQLLYVPHAILRLATGFFGQ